MNLIHLGRRIGDLGPAAFKASVRRAGLEALDHQADNHFIYDTYDDTVSSVAHKAGTNCLAVHHAGQFLASAGADTAVRFWDLEAGQTVQDHEALLPPVQSQSANGSIYQGFGTKSVSALEKIINKPISSISKATPDAHTHSITSLSIYPFDPDPSTLITTSYDQSLILTSITPTSLRPLHKFQLDFTAYTHAINPILSTLLAVGTSHPAPRLIDLRTALATHSLPGHTGSVYSLAWHPTREHILLSASADGRILVFDTRRATPAFASFDADDSLGVPSRIALDYTARAHNGPITGITFSSDGSKLLSAAHDQRIRVWDVATGRNDLVHFGPRIRNTREGELKPIIHDGLVFWPNDDGKGEIHIHDIEGGAVRTLKTKNIAQVATKRSGGASVSRLTSGGRINQVTFRVHGGDVVEMYSAHGDGRICKWTPFDPDGDETHPTTEIEDAQAEKSRKRKRDLIEGLFKPQITFS